MNAPTDWTTAVAILAAGLILGGLLVYIFSQKRSARPLGGEADLKRKDLEAKRDALIRQLRDLDENVSPEERERLELETAAVLRELDAQPAPKTQPAPATRNPQPATESAAISPVVQGFLWGIGSFAALALLTYFVIRSTTPRPEGGTLTGNLPTERSSPGAQPQTQQQQQPDAMLQQMEAAVQRDPNNLQLRNDLAQAYIERDNLMAVFEQTRFVLDRAPNDSRALTFQALVRMAMGERDTAVQMLQKATVSNPKNMDSWVALAWAYVQENKIKEAEAMIAQAAKNSPNDKARLDQVFAQMKAHASMAAGQTPGSQQPAASSQSQQPAAGALPEGHPPVADAGGGVQVTLELDPAATIRSGIVFVIARNPTGGPPVAVKRIVAMTFPTTVELTSADSMMGGQLPAQFRLEARLDSDGDPMTRPTTDPSALQENVAPGATVRLALK